MVVVTYEWQVVNNIYIMVSPCFGLFRKFSDYAGIISCTLGGRLLETSKLNRACITFVGKFAFT